MHDHDTQREEREKWRARILRALAELRHEQVASGGPSRDETPSGNDGSRAAARR